MPQPQGPPKALAGSDERKENGIRFMITFGELSCEVLHEFSCFVEFGQCFVCRVCTKMSWQGGGGDITLKGAWKLNTISKLFLLGVRGIYSKPEFV